MPLADQIELKYRIALTMIPAIGPITARKLIEKVGSAREVFKQKKESLEKIEGIGSRLSEAINVTPPLGQADKELSFMERHRITVVHFDDPVYPHRLNQCADAPILLYMRGEGGLHCQRSLSVVGTRRATSYGRDMCRGLIRDLSSLVDDLVIVSGLAYGIDVIAHRAALDYGLPTVAVLGHGLSTIYPWAHRETAKKIIGQGALLTDFHSGMGPERNNFLRRNRIIAGISQATLVIESPEKGGALITAEMASSYDREVLAVPGRSDDLRSRGCNNMVKNDLAALVDSTDDIIRCLNWDIPQTSADLKAAPEIYPSEIEKHILSLIIEQPGINPGNLSLSTGIPISRILSLLTEMELKQWISVEPGHQYRSRVNIN